MRGYFNCPACSENRMCKSCENHNPEYPSLGAGVAKSRAAAGRDRSKLAEHGEKVLEAIRGLQRQALQRELPSFQSGSASRSWANTGESVLEAVRRQHASALEGALKASWKARDDRQIEKQYAAAMRAKRAAESVENALAA